MHNFSGGHDYEEWLAGRSFKANRLPIGNFNRDIRRIVRAVVSSGIKYPDTPFASSLYGQVVKCLEILGISSKGLHLCVSVGSVVDLAYSTDAFFYLPPSCGRESVVTVDFQYVWPSLFNRLRDFWIEKSRSKFYLEDEFQCNLYRYKLLLSLSRAIRGGVIFDKKLDRIYASAMAEIIEPGIMLLPNSFKALWNSDVAEIHAPALGLSVNRPFNHLILTPNYTQTRPTNQIKVFARLVACAFWGQIHPKVKCPSD